MITVPQKTEEIIKSSPYLEEALAQGILNLSELSRTLQPQIEKELMKDVSEASIVMALKRLQKKVSKKHINSRIIKMFGDITVRSNLMEFTFANTQTLPSKIKKLVAIVPDDVFLSWTRGVHETTIIVSVQMENEIRKLFQKEISRFELSDLATITINLPEDNVSMPGVYYVALKILAWQGINLIEAVSTYTELTIVLEDKDVDKAFSIFKNIK